MSGIKITTLPFLHLVLSPFDSDYALISWPLCKSHTFEIF